MSWRFDPFLVDIIWVPRGQPKTELADIIFGDATESDLEISMGERTNDTSDIDQGLRVYDGDI
jgi:hypothetical protein